MNRRTLVNLITVIIASAVLVLFAVTQLLATAILDNSYPLFVELPEAGGLLENKQVTYRGLAIGEIIEVTLCGDDTAEGKPDCADVESVMVEMGIDNDARVPHGVDAVVLRQSAVGEQALDFRPRAATGPSTDYFEEGELVQLESAPVMPTKPQDLLELADRVFGPVDQENAATVISELADAVEGRREDFQAILVDSATLSESIGDNGADYDRLFAASRVVNASLAENREALANLFTDLADSAQLVGDIRTQVDGLLDTAPGVLDATTDLLARGDADLSCVIRDLGNLNAFTNRPENFANLEESLRVNRWFFDAFRIIGPTSAQGDPWLRVHFISEPEPPAELYAPPRPIPATLPGGACESVFGPGAGSAVQPNHQLAVPEGQVIRPADDRQERPPTRDDPQYAPPGSSAQDNPGTTEPTGVEAAGDGPAEVAEPVLAQTQPAGTEGVTSTPVLGLVMGLAAGLLLVGPRVVGRRMRSRRGGRRG